MQNRDIAGHSISAAAKILKIKSLLTSNARADKFVNPEVISSYNHKTNTIFINIDWVDELDESSEIEIISTCFHETRHAYQWQCIRTGKGESIKVIEQWKREFQDYKTPSNTGNPDKDMDYLSQSIEIDAIAFTYYCMNEIFDAKLFVPKVIKSQVLRKVKTFSKQQSVLIGLDMGKIEVPKQTKIQKKGFTCDEYYQRCLNSHSAIKELEEDIFECIDKTQLDTIVKKVYWLEFSLKFQNKYPEKAEIIIPHLLWDNISVRGDLTEEFVFRFKDYIRFEKLSWKVMTNKIIDTFNDKLNWKQVSMYRFISKELIDKYKDKLDWVQLIQRVKFTENELEKYIDYIDMKHLSNLEGLTEEFIKAHENEFDWHHLTRCNQVPCNLLDKHIGELNKYGAPWWHIRMQNNLEEWFIMKYHRELSYQSSNDSSKMILDKVLKNNNLSKKENRTARFTQWLEQNGYK